MSGPIIRTGATPAFWNNWDAVFGKKSKAGTKASASGNGEAPASKKKAAAKKTASASAGKKVAPKKSAAKKVAKKKN
ncbi:RNA polymerase subunit sigma [Planctomicrobium sp. SH664]|uniref:RNA polymerase subunit sigma n=1 Tax=Planctomicrobium sp. SH664 TaxID=3448125 RepID=UPI003F5C68DD